MISSIVFAALTGLASPHPIPPPVDTVRLGLEVAITDSLHVLQGQRIGLITNHSGLDRRGRRNIDLLYHAPGVKLVSGRK